MATNNPTLQRRRFIALLFFPILVIPSCALLFWLLDGGSANSQTVAPNKGINATVPDAVFQKDGTLDKLSFYEQQQKDSNKLKELISNDPYYNQTMVQPFPVDTAYHQIGTLSTSGMRTGESEQRLSRQLSELNNVLNTPPPTGRQPRVNSSELNQLEQMMQNLQAPRGKDEELEQLSSVMDKVIDMQHPERVKDRLKAQSEKYKKRALPVVSRPADSVVTTLASQDKPSANGFYSIGEDVVTQEQNAIEAITQETQILVAGSKVKMRLLNDIYVSGTLIPKGNFVYGLAHLDNERLRIDVKSIRYLDNIFPVALSAFDLDGVEGIDIPGGITRDVAKQSADQSIQNIGLSSFDPSIGAQAASAGISAAKTLLSRKVKVIKVHVKAGYSVLLRDTNEQNN